MDTCLLHKLFVVSNTQVTKFNKQVCPFATAAKGSCVPALLKRVLTLAKLIFDLDVVTYIHADFAAPFEPSANGFVLIWGAFDGVRGGGRGGESVETLEPQVFEAGGMWLLMSKGRSSNAAEQCHTDPQLHPT